jgi:predicted ribosomally synthesized peptide with nif11-like leader
MTHEEVNRFLAVLEQDTPMQKEVESAVIEAADRFEAIAEVARRHGYPCAASEVKAAIEGRIASADRQLSDEELGSVAGGFGGQIMTINNLGRAGSPLGRAGSPFSSGGY